MLGTLEVPRIYLGNSLVYSSWRSEYAKRFVEFNLDNGYTLGYTAQSIDVYCETVESILDKNSARYLISSNASFGTVNLIDPELHRSQSIGGMTWDVNGATGNGINGHIDLGDILLNITDKFTQNSASFGFVQVSEEPDGRAVVGSSLANPRLYFVPGGGTSALRLNSTGNIAESYNVAGSGFKFINREVAGRIRIIFKTQSNLGTASSTNIVTNPNVTLLRQGSLYSTSSICMFFIGALLNFDETQTDRTAFNTLRTSNGLTAIA